MKYSVDVFTQVRWRKCEWLSRRSRSSRTDGFDARFLLLLDLCLFSPVFWIFFSLYCLEFFSLIWLCGAWYACHWFWCCSNLRGLFSPMISLRYFSCRLLTRIVSSIYVERWYFSFRVYCRSVIGQFMLVLLAKLRSRHFQVVFFLWKLRNFLPLIKNVFPCWLSVFSAGLCV